MSPLAPTLAERWEEFIGEADLLMLRPDDFDRFAAFVARAHRTRREDPIDFVALLSEASREWSNDDLLRLANHLDALYQFGRLVRAAPS